MHRQAPLPPQDTRYSQMASRPPLACPPRHARPTNGSRARRKLALLHIHVAHRLLLAALLVLMGLLLASFTQATGTQSGLRFDPETSSYSDLTFTFDPRLDKRVELLHFEHWLNIMQDSSKILHEALNGRAHLSEVRVLVPFKWRHLKWAMGKPGAPIMTNRKLRYIDSDVIVGFDDPVYKDTPYALQHDECGQQGLHIKMPISFLEQTTPSSQADSRLRARQLVREFAAHRYGLFKESGFRSDPMYPPLVSTPGGQQPTNNNNNNNNASAHRGQFREHGTGGGDSLIRGFDAAWNECTFETRPRDGRPTGQSINCLPYLAASSVGATGGEPISFNLMTSDLFAHAPPGEPAARQWAAPNEAPLEWRQVSDTARFHFCGDNFAPVVAPEQAAPNQRQVHHQHQPAATQHVHNQLAHNKQNIACQERSALDVIRSSDDFRRTSMRAPNFRRLPKLKFNFFQEMAPRVMLAVEYGSHLYQARRLEQGILEAAIGKWLAYDLIAETELALVLFGQNASRRITGPHFRKLEASVESRLGLFSPNIDPFEEEAQVYSEQELVQLELSPQTASRVRLIKGTCSFERALGEALNLMPARHQYEDQGGQLVLLTSGLFIEDEARLEELLASRGLGNGGGPVGGPTGGAPGGAEPGQVSNLRVDLVVYPSNGLYDTRPLDPNQPQLDQLEAQKVIKSRIDKLLAIRRLTGANIHLVREKLDSEGHVKMASLVQLYQVFEHLSRGHSWDRSHSLVMLDEAPVEARTGPGGGRSVQFSFELDGSLRNQLLVGFFEPRQQAPQGKRFALKHLQLRAPNGQLVLNTSSSGAGAGSGSGSGLGVLHHSESEEWSPDSPPTGASESLMFPHRAQLGFAGFQLGPELLNSSRSTLAGRWTLSAISHGPIHTHALALARLNPDSDSISGRCWTQSSFQSEPGADQVEAPNHLRQVKVFAQVEGAQEAVQARLEVHDEQGNIVQNVQMLDDGLGAPDMTRADGLHSQWVQRAHRAGFYRAYVELTGAAGNNRQPAPPVGGGGQWGQDNACCGSFVAADTPASTRHLSRRLYCGTFYVEPGNRLGQQPPPRITNLTVSQVDHDTRRVTLRWPEPLSADLSSAGAASINAHPPVRRAIEAEVEGSQPRAIILEAGGEQVHQQQPLNSRYEIKMFDDRGQLKRAFDSVEPEVGFRFGERQVEGPFPNASQFGGWKEVTLRVPPNQKHPDQLLYVALKVYNNLGLASHLSNIVEFEMRRPAAGGEALDELGYPISGDPNGPTDNELWSDSASSQSSSEFGQRVGHLLRSTTSSMRDGLGLLILICIVASCLALICVSLVGCLVQSARHSMAGPRKPPASHAHRSGSGQVDELLEAIDGELGGGPTKPGAVSSASSSELAMASTSSSGAGSSAGSQHDELDVGKLVGGSNYHHNHQQQQVLAYGALEAQQLHQHHQAQLIQQQQQPSNANYWQLQHTMVNGYAYATVGHAPAGDLNQDGLTGALAPSRSVEAGLYDKVRQHHDTGVDHAQLVAEPGLPDPSTAPNYLLRNSQLDQQQHQQLQAQLSSVLRSRDRKLATDHPSNRRSSPALAGITPDDMDLIQQQQQQQQHYQQFQAVPPPPAHYNIHQEAQLVADPTIYSQTTHLQQVASLPSDSVQNYYANSGANQWDNYSSNGSLVNSNQQHQQHLHQQQQYQPADGRGGSISEV